MFRHCQCAALVLAVVAGAAEAHAQSAVVFLSGDRVDDRLAQGIEGVAVRRGFAFVDRRARKPAPSPIPQAVARAIDAYQGFRYPEALRHLDGAVAALTRGDALGVSAQVMADLFVYRGLARVAVGEADKGWPEFVQAATLAPTRVLDPVRFPPSAVESFGRARAQVAAAEHVEVEFQLAAGCELWVDGHRRAAGPGKLLRGVHYYVMACGRRPVGGRLEVVSEITVAPTIPKEPERTVDAAVELARSQGAQTAVWIEVGNGQPRTARIVVIDLATRGRRQRVVNAGVHPIGVGLGQLLDDTRPAPVTVTREPPRWYQRPWVWAVAGAAVATAIILPLTLGDDTSTSFRVAPSGSLP